MKQWLVDSNLLLDVIGADSDFGAKSLKLLEEYSSRGILVINPVIYAEVTVYLDTLADAENCLPKSLFRRDALPWEAAFLAGKAFRKYKQRSGNKTRMLADFLIGAHACVADMELLSRDQGYGKYFNITVISP